MALPDRTTSQMRPPAGLAVFRRDSYPLLTYLALGGLVAATVLAVVGVPNRDIHGPLHYLGVMDPFCGGTRSMYLTMHAQLGEAIRYNPLSPLLVLLAVAVLIRAAIGWASGRWISVHVPRPVLITVGVVALAALEVNQQMNASLLMQQWPTG